MKKIIVTILTLSALNLAHAQTQTTAPATKQPSFANKPTPEQVAMRNSMHLQKMLELTDDQKQKVHQAILTRGNTLKKIHEKYGADGDKKAMHKEAKPIRTQFVQTMNSILTPAQKTKWEEHRLKIKQHRQQKHNETTPASETGGNGAPQKLTGDDDGIDD